MTSNTALAATSTLVSLAFALVTLDRWLRRHRPHDLAWTVAMALFSLAAASLWWAGARGWSEASFRIFYGVGAVINVPWLGLGTLHLLASPRTARVATRCVAAFTAFAAGVILVAPLTSRVDPATMPTGRDHFGVLPRVLAAVGSAVPATVIFAGAAWSAWRVARGLVPALAHGRRREVTASRRLALGNICIAAGAAILSASGTFSGRLGEETSFSVTLCAGVCVLFLGFAIASGSTRAPAAQRNE